MAETTELAPEDAKLITLARAALARLGADSAAAVRDDTGRTYVAGPVALPSLSLSALQSVVAVAVASGAPKLEAAAVLGLRDVDAEGAAAVRDLLVPTGLILVADASGSRPRRLP